MVIVGYAAIWVNNDSKYFKTMSGETIVDINSFVVAQLTANELGENAKYNVQFIEYCVPFTYQDLIEQVKADTNIEWHELSDGSIRFNKVIYTDV